MELYENQEAVAAHGKTDYFKRCNKKMGPYLGGQNNTNISSPWLHHVLIRRDSTNTTQVCYHLRFWYTGRPQIEMFTPIGKLWIFTLTNAAPVRPFRPKISCPYLCSALMKRNNTNYYYYHWFNKHREYLLWNEQVPLCALHASQTKWAENICHNFHYA